MHSCRLPTFTLLAARRDLEQIDGRTALRVAVDNGFLPVVQELVAAGSIIDWTDKVCSLVVSADGS